MWNFIRKFLLRFVGLGLEHTGVCVSWLALEKLESSEALHDGLRSILKGKKKYIKRLQSQVGFFFELLLRSQVSSLFFFLYFYSTKLTDTSQTKQISMLRSLGLNARRVFRSIPFDLCLRLRRVNKVVSLSIVSSATDYIQHLRSYRAQCQ